jgi:hypothetical protein
LHTHYWFKGVEDQLNPHLFLLKCSWNYEDAQEGIFSNGLVIRRVKETLRESVYDQLSGLYIL